MATETRIPANAAFPTAETELGPLHPHGSGRSFDAARDQTDDMVEDAGEPRRHLMGAPSRRGDETSALDMVEIGARKARRWARRNPMKLWLTIGAVGVASLWLASRPSQPERGFDPARYRYTPPRRPPIRKAAAGQRADSTRPSDSPL